MHFNYGVIAEEKPRKRIHSLNSIFLPQFYLPLRYECSFIIIISKWLNFHHRRKVWHFLWNFSKWCIAIRSVSSERMQEICWKNELIFIKHFQHIEDPCGIVWHVWITNWCDENENDVAYEISVFLALYFFRTKFTSDVKLMPSAHTDSLVWYEEEEKKLCTWHTSNHQHHHSNNNLVSACELCAHIQTCEQVRFSLEVLFLMFHLKWWCYLAIKAYCDIFCADFRLSTSETV